MTRTWKRYRLSTLFISWVLIALVVWVVIQLFFVERTYVIYIRLADSNFLSIDSGCTIKKFGTTIGQVKSVQKHGPGLWLVTAEISQSIHLRQNERFYYVPSSNSTAGYFAILKLQVSEAGSYAVPIQPNEVVNATVAKLR